MKSEPKYPLMTCPRAKCAKSWYPRVEKVRACPFCKCYIKYPDVKPVHEPNEDFVNGSEILG